MASLRRTKSTDGGIFHASAGSGGVDIWLHYNETDGLSRAIERAIERRNLCDHSKPECHSRILTPGLGMIHDCPGVKGREGLETAGRSPSSKMPRSTMTVWSFTISHPIRRYHSEVYVPCAIIHPIGCHMPFGQDPIQPGLLTMGSAGVAVSPVIVHHPQHVAGRK
jgi:hypothetical protein